MTTLIFVLNVMFAAGATGVRLRITPPIDDGGYPLSSYIVEAKNIRENVWKRVGETLAMKVEQGGKFVYAKVYCDVEILEVGETYVFRVRAESQIGLGMPGSLSKQIKIVAAEMFGPVDVTSGSGERLSRNSSFS